MIIWCSRFITIFFFLYFTALSIPEVRQTTTAIISHNARLVCDVNAYPKPQVIWFKDDEPLDLDYDRLVV